MDQISIYTWKNPGVAIFNTQDTAVKMSKSTWIPNGEICDDDSISSKFKITQEVKGTISAGVPIHLGGLETLDITSGKFQPHIWAKPAK